MTAASDETLFRQWREGDPEALERLLERYAAPLRRRVDRDLPPYLRRKVSVADLVQDTRVVLVERASQFEDRGPGSFRNWIFGIARMKLREALRHYAGTAKRAVGREVTRGQRPDTALHIGRRGTPSQHAIARESAARVREALALLPDDYREILRLVREEQLTLAEAGRRMGRSREAAKKLFARATHRFTELFRAPGEGSHE